ncbi:phosphoglucan phosphatase LSF2, chloroplastic-like isoform X2 [Phalaenopsis equestris]|uniref:phosphoglucan phosphatase LSF2, chloroplastic-like isoform X2 n=1 Tax=Phalaenopsis equestris TaxID=78828 RepID=UPI0009E54442|nr:phosphoglucan phosphatase LSF2, chloroplastic-like isoform X2 [Phalaenopsis equestris]
MVLCMKLGQQIENVKLDAAYNKLTTKRPCGPSKTSIRGAKYDLAKNDPSKEPFESLPDYAFDDIADWERKLIQNCVQELLQSYKKWNDQTLLYEP